LGGGEGELVERRFVAFFLRLPRRFSFLTLSALLGLFSS
jgi:hypothetical protein